MENQVNNAHISTKNWYDRNYKILLIIPLILFLFSIFYLVSFYHSNGDIFYKDVSLTGGTTITVFDGNVSLSNLKSSLITQFPDLIVRGISDISSGKQHGFSLETKANATEIKSALEVYLGYNLTSANSSVEFSGASLSSGFYQQLRFAILLAFTLMAIVVFIIFRTPVRSLSIILAGLGDIIMTICVINLLGIQLSTAGIVALLMLIGYSVDVDILLTTRVFRHKEGNLNQRIFGAFKTGITMTLTAMVSIAIALIFTYSISPTLAQMFSIILIGLTFDIINCWVMNASILKWYAEAKNTQ
ncbi:MAG: protein translocase subunit SecF [archaeon]